MEGFGALIGLVAVLALLFALMMLISAAIYRDKKGARYALYVLVAASVGLLASFSLCSVRFH